MNAFFIVALGAALVTSLTPRAGMAQNAVNVGWCAPTVHLAAAPFAIATKLGWYAQTGIKAVLVPLPGATDCVEKVASGEVAYALATIEPVASIRQQGVKEKIFYTAYQTNIFAIAVPVESPIERFADLKGKKVGVISMSSAGVFVARALAAANGMNPDADISVVVAGEGAQTAELLRSQQVDALSQFDVQYARVENAGVKLRVLPTKEIERFPGNGFVALEQTLRNRRQEAVALAQGYAKGTIFSIANPEAAARILWEVFPQTKPKGKDEATALADDMKTLQARAANWKLDKAGVAKWGENSEGNYTAYAEFLLKWRVYPWARRQNLIPEKIDVTQLVTNELIGEINDFDPAAIAAEARAYKVR